MAEGSNENANTKKKKRFDKKRRKLNLKNKETITINGELFFPDIKSDKYNAVVMTHGSGGKRRYHKKYIDSFHCADFFRSLK